MRARRVLFAALVAAVLSTTVHAWSYLAYDQFTVSTSIVTMTAAKISPAGVFPQPNVATCFLESAEIRYSIDPPAQTTISASVGMIWPVSTEKTFTGHDALVNFRAIRDGASDGKLNCTVSAP